MTDITDQDSRDAREWAEDVAETFKYDDEVPRETRAAVNYILATVDAPEPTLAEEVKKGLLFRVNDTDAEGIKDALDLAARVEQIEQERDQARAEVERLTAERDEITADRDRLAASNYILGAKAGAATVAREENVAPDQQGDPLPAPADVPEGQAWIVKVDRTDPTVGFSANGTGWCCYRPAHGTTLPIGDDRITLVSRLVPAPRVITNPDDLDRLRPNSVILSADNDAWQKSTRTILWSSPWWDSSHGGPDMWHSERLCDEDHPVAVLWEP